VIHRNENSFPLQVWIAPVYDVACWTVAIIFASYLRYEVVSGMKIHSGDVFVGVAIGAVLQLLLGSTYIYRHRWRIGSFEEMVTVSGVILCVGLFLIVASTLFLRSGLSYGVVIGATLFALVLAAAGRASYRLATVTNGFRPKQASSNRAIVFGAGDAGVEIIEALATTSSPHFHPVALLDDNPAKRHLRIRNLSVVGNRGDIAKTAVRFRATILLITIAKLEAADIGQLAQLAEEANLEVRILPPLSEILARTVRLSDLRPLTIEDLLGRREVDTDVEAIRDLIRGRRILVTGAGGSIGSELCRQISKFLPASLIMLDRNETGLFETQLSIEGRALLDSKNLVLCDIRDTTALDQIFDDYRPQVVFHAAALKHLPQLEMWPSEALKTNVWGTANVLEAARKSNVQTFVNISTDKAANPISVLGYSKRIAERLTASYGRGNFISVRFGNVLGSQGSFLRAFREQIANGGPITVTDPEVARYFMTISEAVQLTLQAGALGRSREVLVLEMGEQIKIADVARRLAADSPSPIEIVYTGLRRGEKLREELFSDGEESGRTVHPLISSCYVPPILSEICWSLESGSSPESVKRALEKLALSDINAEHVEAHI